MVTEANGLRVSRAYYSLEGEFLEPESVRQNDLFVVVLRGESLDDLDHEALVVDLLPAGFEIENAALGGLARERFGFLPELTEARFETARDELAERPRAREGATPAPLPRFFGR